MRESKVERHLRKRIESLGGLCLKWKSPENNGVPDRIVFVYFQIWFVETKSPTGTMSKLQLYFKRLIMRHTKNYKSIYTLEEVEEFIDEIHSRR
jgi:hypothetical protein